MSAICAWLSVISLSTTNALTACCSTPPKVKAPVLDGNIGSTMSVLPPPSPFTSAIFSFAIAAICAAPIPACIPACITPNGAGISFKALVIETPVLKAVSEIAIPFCIFLFSPPNFFANSKEVVAIPALASATFWSNSICSCAAFSSAAFFSSSSSNLICLRFSTPWLNISNSLSIIS